MINQNCSKCTKKLYKNVGIECSLCMSKFHKKCCTHQDINIHKSTLAWYCSACNTFPFTQLSNHELIDLTNNPTAQNNKMKCFCCNKKIRKNFRYKNCISCKNPFHIKCSTKSVCNWMCSKCLFSDLPFSQITNNDLMLSFSGLSHPCQEYLKNLPKFNIKSLIDSLPGEYCPTDDFISDTIVSKYYTPLEFSKERFNKHNFSIIHINIASLQSHIEELKIILKILGNPFDIIAVTET